MPLPLSDPTVPGASSLPAPVDDDLVDIEIDLLLDGIRRHYGYDFGGYSRPALRRRLLSRMHVEGLRSISQLQSVVLHDRSRMNTLLRTITVPETALFRDPTLFRAIREEITPLLRTWPSLRIWHPGCASGEEVYSMAVLLAEEGLLERTHIDATDVNEGLLTLARTGRVVRARLAASERAHRAAGGRLPLREHLVEHADGLHLSPGILEHISWNRHDLTGGARFNDFHMILCANVLIYYTKPFQDRIHKLLYESLVRFGFLALGEREMVTLTPYARRYQSVPPDGRLWKKVR